MRELLASNIARAFAEQRISKKELSEKIGCPERERKKPPGLACDAISVPVSGFKGVKGLLGGRLVGILAPVVVSGKSVSAANSEISVAQLDNVCHFFAPMLSDKPSQKSRGSGLLGLAVVGQVGRDALGNFGVGAGPVARLAACSWTPTPPGGGVGHC